MSNLNQEKWSRIVRDRRIGKILMTAQAWAGQNHLDVWWKQQILSRYLVVNIRYLPYEDITEYVLFGESFDSLAMGEMIPEYNVVIETDSDGGVSHQVFRVE